MSQIKYNSSCPNLTLQKHEFTIQKSIAKRKTKPFPNMTLICNEFESKTKNIAVGSTFQTEEIVGVRQLKKKI